MTNARPFSFARRGDHRLLAGVCGGFADAYGVSVFVVRSILVVLGLAGGLGIVIYALAFAWSTDPAEIPAGNAPVTPAALGGGRRSVAFACIGAGLALVMRAAGLWLGDAVMSAVVIVLVGLSFLGPGNAFVASFHSAAQRLPKMTAGRYARLRIVGGAVVIAAGLLVVGAQHSVTGRLRLGVVATAATIIGVALLFGPWIARSAQEVAEERRQRIRSEERAEMAAHLHDSVLQTLALIQRNANDPRRTVTLARRQERELRAWLFGGADPDASLAAAVRSMTEDIEARHDVKIDAIVVGDRPMDDAAATVVAAVREAAVNAAKHSGTHDISVFVEVRSDAIEAYVRDRGTGFERDHIAPDRRGITESIEGRVHRAGGVVDIDSAVGSGTEVHLRVPINASALAAEGRNPAEGKTVP